MIPSISNIAWPAEAEAEAIVHSAALGYRGIEIAPTKLFGPWREMKIADVRAFRARLADEGLSIPAMQALLFGRPDLRLFGDAGERAALADHLSFVARVAEAAGAKACVFGSPRQRDPGDRAPETAMEQAAVFFAAVAPVFADHGTAIAFEANVPAFGCRFATRTGEAIALVEAVDHSGFRLQLDLGTVTANGEGPDMVARALPLAAHVHVSEPGLAPVGSLGTDHGALAAPIRAGWSGAVSVEMAAGEDWRAAMEGARAILGVYVGEGAA